MILTNAIFGQGNEVVDLTPNTFIGGVATEIPDKATLAIKLNIAESSIPYFSVVENDIEARIDTNWILGSKFRNINITFLYDYDGNIINSSVDLYDNTTIKEIYLPGILGITGNGFIYTAQCVLYYLPKAEFFGATTGEEYIFEKRPGKPTAKIYCHPSNSTSNSGGVEGDLQRAINFGSQVSYVQNLTPPNTITNLSIGTKYNTALQLNFTPPSSINAIDYYECYANGIYKNDISASGSYIKGLTPGTQYDITLITVDEFYNKSEISNTTTTTTTTTTGFPVEGLVSYYKLDETSGSQVIDNWNANHGINNGATIGVAGKIGAGYSFDGVNDYVELGNSVFSLDNGSVGGWFKTGDAGSGYRGILIKQFAYGIFLSENKLMTYSWGGNSGPKSTTINLNDNSWHHIVLNFRNGIVDGTQLFLDGVLVLTTTITILHQNEPLCIATGAKGTIQNALIQSDEIFCFNRLLITPEISDIYNNGNGLIL